jgi:IS30 family transposase
MGRNGGCDRYRAALADENAWARTRRPKCCKLANSPRLRRAVAGKLRLDWSPEQIAGWLKRTHPEDECNQVSHETIYRSLFVQTRGVLKKELLSHLRSKRSMRRSQPVDPNGDRRGHIKDIVSIRQRPAAVEDRAVPGHWEGDLLSGPNHSYIATLVERHTRYVMLAKVAGIRRQKYHPAARAWDFLSIALSVVTADLAGHRHRSPDGWTREFELEVPVADPTFWNSQVDSLESLLG